MSEVSSGASSTMASRWPTPASSRRSSRSAPGFGGGAPALTTGGLLNAARTIVPAAGPVRGISETTFCETANSPGLPAVGRCA